MKKIGISILIVFISIATFYAFVQSNMGRNYLRHLLTQQLKESGFSIQIAKLEGTIPHQMHLKDVTIEGKGIKAHIKKLSFRPVLWRLLQKQIALNQIDAKEISIQEHASFDFQGKFRLNEHRIYLKGNAFNTDFKISFNRDNHQVFFIGKNDLFYGKAKAKLKENFTVQSAHLQIGSDAIFSHLPIEAKGRFLAHIQMEQQKDEYIAKAVWQVPTLLIEKNKIQPIKGKALANWKEGKLNGFFTLDPFTKASFDLFIRPDGLISGISELIIEQLQSLPFPKLYGKLQAKASWDVVDNRQELHVDGALFDFYFDALFAKKISLYSDLKSPFQHLQGMIDLEAEKLKWNYLEIESASFETKMDEKNHPFRFFAEGDFRRPFEIHMNGFWQPQGNIEIKALQGTFLDSTFALQKEFNIELFEEKFKLSQAHFLVGEGSALVEIEKTKNQANAKLYFDHLPLEIFSLNPLEFDVAGFLNLELSLKEKNGKLDGTFQGFTTHILPIESKGSFKGVFHKNTLDLFADFSMKERPFLKLDLSLPIHLSLLKPKAEILFHKPAKGKMSIEGPLEEFLDFFDLGAHRLEGICKGEFTFRNTLFRPLVEGKLFFENGFYENYYTGLKLKNIQAEFLAEKNNLYLQNLKAQDEPGGGSFLANGEIHLLQSDLYPFRIDLQFDHLQFAQIDLVDAIATGKVRIEGNSLSAIAKGEIAIDECNLSIPNHIPRPLPHLQVTYRNPISPLEDSFIKKFHPYPLYLDVQVTSPSTVSISGRGLSSIWRGDFALGGTYTSPAAKGKLELIEGEFNFSARSFKLIEGSLTLSGIEHQMPSLHLIASTETKGIHITATLAGPLNQPQLTLLSSPPLPLGSIMSYLLFGQDLSEIGSFQALQLASSLASLAGTGPDVLENTRKSLGIDRLRVISDPDGEGGENVSLEVGKYISKGVLVSFTQGAEESSTNISVEIELKNNFVFQIESDQRQEQGKFTLKWNLNY